MVIAGGAGRVAPCWAPVCAPPPSTPGNSLAIVADRKYVAHVGPDGFYTVYRLHDLHFKVYGAMFLGQLAPAMDAANEVRQGIECCTVAAALC
jgi:hypothetical protein